VVDDDTALRLFSIRPLGVREAIASALRNEDREVAETRWSDAFSSSGLRVHRGGVRFGSRIVDSRAIRVGVSGPRAFAPIRRIGGETGYYYANWLWRVRGFLDLVVGGVGVRRGRPHPDHLNAGDAVDWWRVERIVADRKIRLVAEMKIPRAGMARVRGRAGWRRIRGAADGDFRSARPLRSDLLVRPLPDPPTDLRGDAAGDRTGGGAGLNGLLADPFYGALLKAPLVWFGGPKNETNLVAFVLAAGTKTEAAEQLGIGLATSCRKPRQGSGRVTEWAPRTRELSCGLQNTSTTGGHSGGLQWTRGE